MKKQTDYELKISTEREAKKELKRMRDIGKRAKETERRRDREETENFHRSMEEWELTFDFERS